MVVGFIVDSVPEVSVPASGQGIEIGRLRSAALAPGARLFHSRPEGVLFRIFPEAELEDLFSPRQQRLLRIQQNLANPCRRGKAKWGYRPLGKDVAQENALARE